MLVAVVMGGRTGASRDAQMRKLIAEYLPQASRGSGTGNLIARSGASPMLAASAFTLPDRGPVPIFRDPVDVRVATAYAPTTVSQALAAFPVPAGKPVVGRAALAATLLEQRPDGPVPPAPIGAPVQTAAVEMGSSAVDAVTTSSTTAAMAESVPSGWVVQVAAMPDRSEAMAYLTEAQRKAGGVVAEAQPFTVAFSDGGQSLYRARFGGFAGKDAAWAACASLKRSGYGCWATQQ
jgi:D-alanyl-D-alanine carboxypeptidase